jgi:transposase
MTGGKGKVRIMVCDEAGFGRISSHANCWGPVGERAVVPSQQVREFVYVYGAVDPKDGASYFMSAPKCNSDWTGQFFKELSVAYPNDLIILILDNATWHKSKTLDVPDNIKCLFIPPYTPELNPIEQVWKHMRIDFSNQLFASLKAVTNQLLKTVKSLKRDELISITGRDWILDIF